MNKLFVEKPKNMIINLIISFVVILATVAFAGLSGSDLVIQTAWYILIIHWVAFLPALIFKTEKFYDLTGSICYAFGSVFVYYQTYGATFSLSLFISIAVLIWTIRLGSFLLKRVLDAGEDKRFRTIKTSPTQFFMTFNLSALWVVICSLCALTAVSNGVVAVGPIFYLGLFIFIAGFSIEVIADNQKTQFRAIPDNANKFITTGLWSVSRHPNYFGEVVLWAGVAIMSLTYLEGVQYWTLISPIFSFVLIYFVSGVRMLEARANVKWGENMEYQKYVKKTPVFFPKIF
jgi:steroid 5-alpha reductase family enzyme